MLNRKLRFVRIKPTPMAVCERCGAQFESKMTVMSAARVEVEREFKFHECEALDSSQNALMSTKTMAPEYIEITAIS